MLKIDPNMTFVATATINLKALQASFGIRCKLLDIDVLNDLRDKWTGVPARYADPEADIAAARPPIEPAKPATLDDRQFIDAWLAGFEPDVVGADDQPLPFTPENVSLLLRQPGAKIAVINAFMDGYAEAEAKNSAPPPAGS